jgi:hypothetical protein
VIVWLLSVEGVYYTRSASLPERHSGTLFDALRRRSSLRSSGTLALFRSLSERRREHDAAGGPV